MLMTKLKIPSPPALLGAWLPFAITITILSGVIYGTVQQDLRMGANDVPSQLAQDAISRLSKGDDPAAVLPDQTVEAGKSLSPFVIVFDKDSNVVASSLEKVDGKVPLPPSGVFAYTKKHLLDKISWQLKDDQRFAIVMRYFDGEKRSGYVLAGRDLHDVEQHEAQTALIVLAGWFSSMFGTFVVVWAAQKSAKKRR